MSDKKIYGYLYRKAKANKNDTEYVVYLPISDVKVKTLSYIFICKIELKKSLSFFKKYKFFWLKNKKARFINSYQDYLLIIDFMYNKSKRRNKKNITNGNTGDSENNNAQENNK